MKIRVVIEEVVVDAETADGQYAESNTKRLRELLTEATESALKLHAARKPTAADTDSSGGGK